MEGTHVYKPESNEILVKTIIRDFLSDNGSISHSHYQSVIDQLDKIIELIPKTDLFYDSSILMISDQNKLIVKLIDFTHYNDSTYHIKYPDTGLNSNPISALCDLRNFIDHLWSHLVAGL
jgi:hypothetical protein